MIRIQPFLFNFRERLLLADEVINIEHTKTKKPSFPSPEEEWLFDVRS